ncbi:MAG: hypothetical protein FJ267_11485, partial [Planctomycetes bacterium]|nr:hypothetical protein [Planctomycetota bacterium]
MIFALSTMLAVTVLESRSLEAASLLSPDLVTSFQGVDDAINGGPASAQIAVGPNHIVQAVNSSIRITNKTGGAVTTVSAQSIFGAFYAANSSYTVRTNISRPLNPSAVYDELAKRFIIAWGAVNHPTTES